MSKTPDVGQSSSSPDSEDQSRANTSLTKARHHFQRLGWKTSQPTEAQDHNYETVNLSGNASAILGNVVHYHHNHFGGLDPRYLLGLQKFEDGTPPDPDVLSDYDFQYARWLHTNARLEGTCTWIFSTREYTEWHVGVGPPILLCAGTVGCGKSITAGAVADKLEHKSITHPLGCLLSYFVDPARSEPPKAVEVLRALVKQLLVSFRDSSDVQVYNSACSQVQAILKRGPSFLNDVVQLTSLLEILLSFTSETKILIDGCDSMSENEILALLDAFGCLFANKSTCSAKAKLILFCRETLGRGIRLESVDHSVVLPIRLVHVRADLLSFIDHLVDKKQSQRAVTNDTNLIAEVKRVLRDNCAKMFVWARLQVLNIWNPNLITCDEHIRAQLQDLPAGLEEIYERCLRRIESTNDGRSKDIAPKAFTWVATAKQPLTQIQLREAVTFTRDSMPPSKSEMLNNPVEDYCANLVVQDERTGKMTFPHRSVKEFLASREKLPQDLWYYGLFRHGEGADLYCGSLCLAYAQAYRAKQQIVVHTPLAVNTQLALPILETAIGAASFIFRHGRHKKHSKADRFQLAVTGLPSKQSIDPSGFSMHDYMCKNWIVHCQQIDTTHEGYEDFEALCLSHDPLFQPWATQHALLSQDHWAQLVSFAVMMNHVPLLKVATAFLNRTKRHLLNAILEHGCPGTDSTFLHVAAALGHQNVLPALLRFCSIGLADFEGRSPAWTAIENGHYHLLDLLLPSELEGDGSWELNPFRKDRKRCREMLLRQCASRGNAKAVTMVLSRMKHNPLRRTQQALSDALLHATANACTEVARLLVSAGANPDEFDLNFVHTQYYTDTFAIEVGYGKISSSMDLAIDLRRPSMMEALIEVGADADFSYHVFKVFKHLDSQATELRPFVNMLARHGRLLPQTDFPFSSSYLSSLLQYTYVVPGDRIRFYSDLHNNRLFRLVWGSAEVEGFTKLKRFDNDISENSFQLNTMSDDLLVNLIRNGWLSRTSLLKEHVLKMLFNRLSSRGLEALLDLLSCDHTIRVGSSGTNKEAGNMRFSDLLVWHWCGCTDFPNIKYPESTTQHQIFTILLGRCVSHRLNCSESRIAVLRKRAQDILRPDYLGVDVLKFLRCYEFIDRDETGERIFDYVWGKQRKQFLVQQMKAAAEMSTAPKISPLKVARCFKHGKSKEAAASLAEELHRIGSDCNPILNFPAGYFCRQTHGISYCNRWVLSANIDWSILEWNYRLNRARKKPFSDADRYYICAKVLINCAKRL